MAEGWQEDFRKNYVRGEEGWKEEEKSHGGASWTEEVEREISRKEKGGEKE